MSNLYFIEYGCSICMEHLIVSAEDEETANEYAYQSAKEVYFSYSCNDIDPDDYPDADEDELAEIQEQEMESDIQYLAVLFDPNDIEHTETLREQNNKPHEI